MIRIPPVALAIVAVALLTASCASDVDVAAPPGTPTASPTPSADPTPMPPPTPTPQGRADLPDDQFFEPGPRLAITDEDGQIFTALSDGSNPVPLTDRAEGTTHTLPTWSADASRLAWVTTDEGTGDAWVRSARFDGTGWFEQPMEAPPRHLAWDPSSSQVATLSPSPGGLELGVVSFVEANYTAIDEGSPFWFSWSPDADGFLVHASGVRLDLVPVNGPSQVLEQAPGAFQSPRWLARPEQLLYADDVDDEQSLVVAGRDGAGRRALVSYDGYLQFVVAPTTGWIALQVIDPSRAPVPDVITASFQADDFIDAVDPVPRNELTVIATFGGDPFVVYPGPDDLSPDPVLAFYWSADGNSLGWLIERDPGDGDCSSETAQYEWQFMVDDAVVGGPRFHPTATFACEYVPAFDQLDQDVSFWSPDGALLTYAGTDVLTGERGIWNVDVAGFTAPVKVADGEIAVWSPAPAGSGGQSAL